MNTIEQVSLQCPYCGQQIDLEIDCSAGEQQYTEDCPVCCKPVAIKVSLNEKGMPAVEATPEDS